MLELLKGFCLLLGFYFAQSTRSQWRGRLSFQILFPVMLVCSPPFVPKSPRWRKWRKWTWNRNHEQRG